MTPQQAARILGVQLDGLTENEISIAFKRAIKLAHPDAGGARYDAAENIERAKKARDTLTRLVAYREVEPCATCKGTGQVRGSLLNRVCPSCKGSGRA